MAIGSGLSAQLGGKKETTYGTPVTVDQFWEFGSETLKLDKNYILSRQLRAGRTFQSSSRRTATTRSAAGNITLEVPTLGFGFWIDLLHGNTVTPVQQAATTAYLQTHNIGTTAPDKSATIQVGRPDTGGTVRAFTYTSAMVTSWQLNFALNEFLIAEFGLDAQEELTATALATASYPTGLQSFNFTQGSIYIGGVLAANILGGSIQGGLPRKVDRFYMGATGLKAKPIQNDYATAGGTLNTEFTNLTQYGLFTAGTISEVRLEFISSALAGTAIPFSVKVTMAACGYEGETPNVSGPDVLDQPLPFVALDDGTNPPVKIEIMEQRTTAL